MSAQQAASRLAAITRPETFFRRTVADSGSLFGRVSDLHFRITTYIPFVHSSFNSILEGAFVPAPGGCQLIGAFRLRPFTSVFMGIWLALATVMGTVLTISALLMPNSWHPSPPPPLSGLILPIGGIALLAIGRSIATLQERALIRALDQVLGVQS